MKPWRKTGTVRFAVLAAFAAMSACGSPSSTAPAENTVIAEPVIAEPVIAEPVVAEPAIAEPVIAEVDADDVLAEAAVEVGSVEESVADPLEDDEAGEIPFDRELLGRERIGPGARAETLIEAAGAGMRDPLDEEAFLDDEIASIVVRRDTFVLFRARSGQPEFDELSQLEDLCVADQRAALWLARVRESGSTDPYQRFERVEAVRLMDLVVGVLSDNAECELPAEMRARDLDGDGETELTIIAPYAPLGPDSFTDTCGEMAFLVGADLNVQAQFLRHFMIYRMDAGGEYQETEDTTWRIADLDGDGHADLHVNEVNVMSDEFEGDYAGPDDEGFDTNFAGRHRRERRRLEVDCLWEEATDRWNCPPVEGHRLGQSRLWSPSQLIAIGGPRERHHDPALCNQRRSLFMPLTRPGEPALSLLGEPHRE